MITAFDPVIPLQWSWHICKGMCPQDVSIACTCKVGKDLNGWLRSIFWPRIFISNHSKCWLLKAYSCTFLWKVVLNSQGPSSLRNGWEVTPGCSSKPMSNVHGGTKAQHLFLVPCTFQSPHGIRLRLDLTKSTSFLSFRPATSVSPWLLYRFLLKVLLKISLMQEFPSRDLLLENPI